MRKLIINTHHRIVQLIIVAATLRSTVSSGCISCEPFLVVLIIVVVTMGLR
jgi:hypothetical protein